MSVEIQWTEDLPDGTSRIVRVERFARGWNFAVRSGRRTPWEVPATITVAMWEDLLEALERRIQRSEGVTEADIAGVRKELGKARSRPSVVFEAPPTDA